MYRESVILIAILSFPFRRSLLYPIVKFTFHEDSEGGNVSHKFNPHEQVVKVSSPGKGQMKLELLDSHLQ